MYWIGYLESTDIEISYYNYCIKYQIMILITFTLYLKTLYLNLILYTIKNYQIKKKKI